MRKQRLLLFRKKQTCLFLIFLLGFLLRIYGLNWDQGFHLHPDERFLTMVGNKIDWPRNVFEYFDANNSPLNPHNNGYDFFVYGPLPLFLTKLVAGIFGLDNYVSFNLVGRLLSSLFDLGVIILLFKISKKIWPSLLYSLMVLPIQLSHFFAVDTFLNFFLVLTFCSAFNWPAILTGLFLGLALSCKVSVLLFVPIVLLIFFLRFKRVSKELVLSGFLFLIATLISFRIFSPYSFSGIFKISPQFIENLRTLNSFNNPDAWFPPAVQWIKTKPIVFPFINLLFWGLGLPMGILVVTALFKYSGNLFEKLFKRKAKIKIADYLIVSLIWVFLLFFFQGIQFVKTMRYFLPIYPFLALLAGDLISKLSKKSRFAISFLIFLYPLSFMAIYLRPHSRVTASEWIFENVSSEAVLSCEHWDDCLPLLSGGTVYETETLPLYNPDSKIKWQEISTQLEKIDYLILSSNRLWGSIPTVPEKYPITAKYYQLLLDEKLGFKKIKEFTSYPFLLKDDWAEEAFTVYDHPKVIIFENQGKFTLQDIYQQLFATD